MKSLSIKARLMLTLLSAVFVTTSVVSIIGYNQSKDMLETRLFESDLPTKVQLARNAVNAEVYEMKSLTRSIATNPFLLEWLDKHADDNHQGEETLIAYLKEMVKGRGFSVASFADRKTARYWNQEGFLRTLKPGDLDGWFFAFTSSGNDTLMSSYTYPDGKMDLFSTYQLVDGRGLGSVAKSFTNVAKYLSGFKIEKTGFIYIVDQDGLVKVHKNSDLVNNKKLGQLYAGIHQQQMLDQADFNYIEVDGQIVSTSYIPEMGWYIVAQVPKAELYHDINKSAQTQLVLSLFVFLGFALFAYFLSSTIVAPINRMAELFRTMGDEETDLSKRLDTQGAKECTGSKRYWYSPRWNSCEGG